MTPEVQTTSILIALAQSLVTAGLVLFLIKLIWNGSTQRITDIANSVQRGETERQALTAKVAAVEAKIETILDQLHHIRESRLR